MARVIRKQSKRAKKFYKPWNAREALPLLLCDFKNRCAYSMVHRLLLADRQLHVDHFDPTKKKKCGYDNLFPAYDVCNEAKGSSPTPFEIAAGMRLLNPCEEHDYGSKLYEDPATHKLLPADDIAEFHIGILDLNNRNLVSMRRDRVVKAKIIGAGILNPNNPAHLAILKQLQRDVKYGIPVISPPTAAVIARNAGQDPA